MDNTHHDEIAMVTGHRAIRNEDLVLERLTLVLEAMRPSLAISGGAQGADTLFVMAAIDADIPFKVMLPNQHYRKQYPGAIPSQMLAQAVEIDYTVDRPDVDDWQRRWKLERWWIDNFARNEKMLKEATITIAVTADSIFDVVTRRSGTSDCLNKHIAYYPGKNIIWVPDNPNYEIMSLDPNYQARSV